MTATRIAAGDDPIVSAFQLHKRGMLELERRDFSRAAHTLEKALALLGNLDEVAITRALWLTHYATALRHQRRLNEAARVLHTSLDLLEYNAPSTINHHPDTGPDGTIPGYRSRSSHYKESAYRATIGNWTNTYAWINRVQWTSSQNVDLEYAQKLTTLTATLLILAECTLELGDAAKACRMYQQVLTIGESTGHLIRSTDTTKTSRIAAIAESTPDITAEIVRALIGIANSSRIGGYLTEARNALDEVGDILQDTEFLKNPDSGVLHASYLDSLALCLSEMGDLAEAEILYQEAIDLLQSHLGSEVEQADTVTHLANTVAAKGNPQATDLYCDALIMYRQRQETDAAQAKAAINLATTLIDIGELSEAAPVFAYALDALDDYEGTEHDQARCLSGLGTVYALTGRLSEARNSYLNALALLKSPFGSTSKTALGTPLTLTKPVSTTPDSFEFSDDVVLANPAAQPPASTTRDEAIIVAGCIENLAALLRQEGSLSEATNLYNHSLDLLEHYEGTEYNRAICFIHLAQIEVKRDDYSTASALYAEALALTKARQLPRTQAIQDLRVQCLLGSATCHLKLTGFKPAKKKFARAKNLLEQQTGQGQQMGLYVDSLIGIAKCQMYLKKPQESERYYRKALEIAQSDPSDTTRLHTCIANLMLFYHQRSSAANRDTSDKMKALHSLVKDIWNDNSIWTNAQDPAADRRLKLARGVILETLAEQEDTTAEDRHRYLTEALTLVIPVAITIHRRQFLLPSEIQRIAWRNSSGEAATHLAFSIAEKLDLGPTLSEFIALWRFSGVPDEDPPTPHRRDSAAKGRKHRADRFLAPEPSTLVIPMSPPTHGSRLSLPDFDRDDDGFASPSPDVTYGTDYSDDEADTDTVDDPDADTLPNIGDPAFHMRRKPSPNLKLPNNMRIALESQVRHPEQFIFYR